MTKYDAGPAFPQERTLEDGSHQECEGISIRDYFAIRAFQTRLAKYSDWTLTELTKQSYADADAMLEARK